MGLLMSSGKFRRCVIFFPSASVAAAQRQVSERQGEAIHDIIAYFAPGRRG